MITVSNQKFKRPSITFQVDSINSKNFYIPNQ